MFLTKVLQIKERVERLLLLNFFLSLAVLVGFSLSIVVVGGSSIVVMGKAED